MRLVGLFFLAAALAGCAASGPSPLPTDAEAWVDCRFRDGSEGHVQQSDCAAASGEARTPENGRADSWGMIVEWEGHDRPIRGVMTAPETGLAGPLRFQLDGGPGPCEGSFRYTKTSRGTWLVDCGNGLTASGRFSYGGGHIAAGYGNDSAGNTIMFQAWPLEQ